MPRWRRWLVARCSCLLAISTFTAQWMARRAAIDVARIRVVPLPVDPVVTDRGAVRFTPGNDYDRLRLLTVCTLTPEHRYKGTFTIVDALPLVLERCPDVRWTVVGDGPDHSRLRRILAERGLSDHVTLLGKITDSELASAYDEAAVFVMPSVADPSADPPIGEGFGLVYIEAAAHGVPSIASTAGGGSLDFVRHLVTGLTVAPSDPNALADAIVTLLDDPAMRNRLGAAALALACERHTQERFASELSNALRVPVLPLDSV